MQCGILLLISIVIFIVVLVIGEIIMTKVHESSNYS